MSQPAPLHTWLIEPLEPAVAQVIDRLRRADDVAHVAVMPDVHLARDVCVGTVLGTHKLLYPAAVGGDIGCGMLAIATDAPVDLLSDGHRAGQLLQGMYSAVPAARRHRSRTVSESAPLSALRLSHTALEAFRRTDGALQLGTLGGGNHFIELQLDPEDRLWLMIHSGSRGLGQVIRDHHLARAVKASGPLASLDAATDSGQAYLNDVAVARQYARESRLAMAHAVGDLLRELAGVHLLEETLLHCDHNHVALEHHGGQALYVHRKGAMPAGDGVPGLLPGSMGSPSFHVEGRGNADSLCSSAHGAGRALSREAARKRVTARDLARQMEGRWFDYRLAGQLREEAPSAYKQIGRIVRAQRDLTRTVRMLEPALTYKSP